MIINEMLISTMKFHICNTYLITHAYNFIYFSFEQKKREITNYNTLQVMNQKNEVINKLLLLCREMLATFFTNFSLQFLSSFS